MRKEFIQVNTKKAAQARMPWACIIVKVESGYIGFESITEYETWKKQK